MNVHLDERAIPDGFEAANLAGRDGENVPPSATLQTSLRSRPILRGLHCARCDTR